MCARACSSRPRESSFIRRLFIRLLINLITCSCACCLAEPPFTLHPEPVLNHSPLLHSHISHSHNYVVNPWTTSKTSNILPNRVRQIKAWLFADYSHRKEPYFQISVISNVKLQDNVQICCTRSKKKKRAPTWLQEEIWVQILNDYACIYVNHQFCAGSLWFWKTTHNCIRCSI